MAEHNPRLGKRLTATELGEALLQLRKDGGFDNIFAELADPKASQEEWWHGAHTIAGGMWVTLQRMGVIE